jgi:hypothetical protein
LLTTKVRLLGLSSVVATSVLSSIGIFVASLKKINPGYRSLHQVNSL